MLSSDFSWSHNRQDQKKKLKISENSSLILLFWTISTDSMKNSQLRLDFYCFCKINHRGDEKGSTEKSVRTAEDQRRAEKDLRDILKIYIGNLFWDRNLTISSDDPHIISQTQETREAAEMWKILKFNREKKNLKNEENRITSLKFCSISIRFFSIAQHELLRVNLWRTLFAVEDLFFSILIC